MEHATTSLIPQHHHGDHHSHTAAMIDPHVQTGHYQHVVIDSGYFGSDGHFHTIPQGMHWDTSRHYWADAQGHKVDTQLPPPMDPTQPLSERSFIDPRMVRYDHGRMVIHEAGAETSTNYYGSHDHGFGCQVHTDKAPDHNNIHIKPEYHGNDWNFHGDITHTETVGSSGNTATFCGSSAKPASNEYCVTIPQF